MPLQMLVAEPRLLGLRRPARDRPHRERHAAARARTSRSCRTRRHASTKARVTNLYAFEGLERVEVPEAGPGDIVALAGFDEVHIGDTITDPEDPRPLPPRHRRRADRQHDLPRQQLAVRGPGGQVRHLAQPRERLERELLTNVSIRVEPGETPDAFKVVGPRRAADGDPDRDDAPRGLRAGGRQARGHHPHRSTACKQEPMEHLVIDCPEEFVGVVTQKIGAPQGPHDQHGQPRHRPRAARVPHPVARADRLPQPVPHRHARHRPAEPPVRRLRAVAGRDPAPHDRRARRRPRRQGHRRTRSSTCRTAARCSSSPTERVLRGHDRRRERARSRTSTSTSSRRRS